MVLKKYLTGILIFYSTHSQVLSQNNLFDQFISSCKDSTDSTDVVYVFASWCKPCLESFPKLAEIKSNFSNQNVRFWMISIDKYEEAMKNCLAKYNPGWRAILLNKKDERSLFEGKFGTITAVPLIFIIEGSKNKMVTIKNCDKLRDKLEKL